MLLFYEHEPSATEIELKEFEDARATSFQPVQFQHLDSLPQYGPYAFIPYRPSNDPTFSTTLPLTLNNTSTWTYCGPLLGSNATDLPPSFHTWNTITLSHPSIFLSRLTTLLSFLHSFLSAANVEHYWLTLRATKPTSDYDIPRWHVDENFFSTSNDDTKSNKLPAKRHWKLATALLGPQTLFQKHNASALSILRKTCSRTRSTHAHTCASFHCPTCATSTASVRSCLAHSLSSHPSTSALPHEVSFFRIGEDEGAVHSEPACNVDRIFVNVVPGTEEELKGLLGRWGLEYPRAWCFGVPVEFEEVDMRREGREGEGVRIGNSMSVNVSDEYMT